MTDVVITGKIQRFLEGQPLRVIDLFAGAGGMSLGFQAAGYQIMGGIELDPLAAQTHAHNLHREPKALQAVHAKDRDITTTEPFDFIRELYPHENPRQVVDIIVGGPPCQAFARVGRAKLREIADHPQAFRLDERAQLYMSYLHYVRQLKPLAVLMENVPDILNYGGHNIAEEICETLDDLGYECRYTLLNSVYYDVPQMRERLFLIGITRELGMTPTFPAPTRWIKLPSGYEGTRQVALKPLGYNNQLNFLARGYLTWAPEPTNDLPRAVSAREALADLPPITTHLEGNLRRGARRFNTLAPYRTDVVPSPYAQLMRTWPGFASHLGVYDHVIRSLPRDYQIFRRMRPGDQYPQAYAHAQALFQEQLAALRTAGEDIPEGSPRYEQLRTSIVPPYDPGKFPNKWRKLEPDMPVRTLMAHLGKDGYSHIHYDDNQARTISVREAARLQSFPDGYFFIGTMNPAFRQIGNAVPPLLARALAAHLLQLMRSSILAPSLQKVYG